jgi:excisionase family DNA binding protein
MPTKLLPDDAPEMLVVGEAVRYSRVGKSSIYAWIKSGRLASIQPPGTRKRLIPKASLEAFLLSGLTGVNSPAV